MSQIATATGFRSQTHFGRFGGCFAAETLMPELLELERAFLEAQEDPDFHRRLSGLLGEYAGRPTPLTMRADSPPRSGCSST